MCLGHPTLPTSVNEDLYVEFIDNTGKDSKLPSSDISPVLSVSGSTNLTCLVLLKDL